MTLQGGKDCTRWMKAGRNPGPVYWLKPGTRLRSRESVVFSGLHSLEEAVYFLPEESAMAIALYVLQPVAREIQVKCMGRAPIQSMQLAMACLNSLRIVSFNETDEMYMYHGMWLITNIDSESEQQAIVTLLNMPG